MPAKSKAQQRLFAAADHGATFPKAVNLRQSLSHAQLHDFAAGSMAGKPERVAHPHRNLGTFLHPPKRGK